MAPQESTFLTEVPRVRRPYILTSRLYSVEQARRLAFSEWKVVWASGGRLARQPSSAEGVFNGDLVIETSDGFYWLVADEGLSPGHGERFELEVVHWNELDSSIVHKFWPPLAPTDSFPAGLGLSEFMGGAKRRVTQLLNGELTVGLQFSLLESRSDLLIWVDDLTPASVAITTNQTAIAKISNGWTRRGVRTLAAI
jgi:hypothetical protein